MNNKGFTLIELLATVMILALITSVGAYSIINYLNKAKEKSYDLLIENIKIGAQELFVECENIDIMGDTIMKDACDSFVKSYHECQTNARADKCVHVSFRDLAKYGFLKTSESKEDNKIIKNPINDKDISNCIIGVTKSYGDDPSAIWYDYFSVSSGGSVECPTDADYNNDEYNN